MIYDVYNQKPPDFFAFNDPSATYVITFDKNKYFINYKTTSSRKKAYGQNITIYVGNSNTDLHNFVDKPVLVEGEFVYDEKQCIAGKCLDINDGGKAVVINISSIRIK